MKLRIAKKIAAKVRDANSRLPAFRLVERAGRRLGEHEGAVRLYCNRLNAWLLPDESDPFDYEDDFFDGDSCHYCGGDGAGIVGCDWDSDDPINGPYPGEVQDCPCCGGSGKADDCTFW